jgi:hypothetical protein
MVTETAARHGTCLCRQGCGTEIYFAYVDGKLRPINARDDKPHDCWVYKRAQMIGAKEGTIPMKRFLKNFDELEQAITFLSTPRERTFTQFVQEIEANWPVIVSNMWAIRTSILQQQTWNADFIEKNNEYEAKYAPKKEND